MVCYTSKRNTKQAPAGDDWNIASTKDILNNFFNKDVIAGIIFNPGLKNMVLVLKPILEAIMPGEKEKPSFFRGPK